MAPWCRAPVAGRRARPGHRRTRSVVRSSRPFQPSADHRRSSARRQDPRSKTPLGSFAGVGYAALSRRQTSTARISARRLSGVYVVARYRHSTNRPRRRQRQYPQDQPDGLSQRMARRTTHSTAVVASVTSPQPVRTKVALCGPSRALANSRDLITGAKGDPSVPSLQRLRRGCPRRSPLDTEGLELAEIQWRASSALQPNVCISSAEILDRVDFIFTCLGGSRWLGGHPQSTNRSLLIGCKKRYDQARISPSWSVQALASSMPCRPQAPAIDVVDEGAQIYRFLTARHDAQLSGLFDRIERVAPSVGRPNHPEACTCNNAEGKSGGAEELRPRPCSARTSGGDQASSCGPAP